jgi:DNA (cytosine-5)-methyltransferase 1
MFKLIDLFAGPGGLGEGFGALDQGKTFQIGVSAEMEASAHATLTLRSLYRHLKRQGDQKGLATYYDFCNSDTAPHPRDKLISAWKMATEEAQQLTLGKRSDNKIIYDLINARRLNGEETVVIGGPPCQAYSLVGRARNQGKTDYVAEDDPRHYLYKQYLHILHRAKPSVFVMENVKGILSSRVGGRRVFLDILNDLTNPSVAVGKTGGMRYTIHSLVVPTKYERGMSPDDIDVNDFIVRSELYGIPQARHRVILLGVREDMHYNSKYLLVPQARLTVNDAIGELPKLRSRLSKDDSSTAWQEKVFDIGTALEVDARKKGELLTATYIAKATNSIQKNLDIGSLRLSEKHYDDTRSKYLSWVRDHGKLDVWLNHQTRSHMDTDLGRYLYAAAFAGHHQRSPKGHGEFHLAELAPAHRNWMTGKFSDRFRVQLSNAPSTTITSHIAKDGHYFIHPDPAQCRSLTAREAARLQTFPDNYFFEGNRTQQYHQVGNAVPPLLANKIAKIVSKILQEK